MGTLSRRVLISGIECDPPPGFSPAPPGWDRPVGLTAAQSDTWHNGQVAEGGELVT